MAETRSPFGDFRIFNPTGEWLPLTGGRLTGPLHLPSQTPDQDTQAVTKSYVDTSIAAVGMVRARGSAGLTDLSTTEAVLATATLTIPTTWTGYEVDLWGYMRTNMNGAAGAADLRVRIRRNALGGVVKGFGVDELSNAADRTDQMQSLAGYDTGLSTTGSVSYVLTAQLTAQDLLYRTADVVLIAYAWRTA